MANISERSSNSTHFGVRYRFARLSARSATAERLVGGSLILSAPAATAARASRISASNAARQHRLNLRLLPHRHASLRPTDGGCPCVSINFLSHTSMGHSIRGLRADRPLFSAAASVLPTCRCTTATFIRPFAFASSKNLQFVRLTAFTLSCAARAHVPKSSGATAASVRAAIAARE